MKYVGNQRKFLFQGLFKAFGMPVVRETCSAWLTNRVLAHSVGSLRVLDQHLLWMLST